MRLQLRQQRATEARAARAAQRAAAEAANSEEVTATEETPEEIVAADETTVGVVATVADSALQPGVSALQTDSAAAATMDIAPTNKKAQKKKAQKKKKKKKKKDSSKEKSSEKKQKKAPAAQKIAAVADATDEPTIADEMDDKPSDKADGHVTPPPEVKKRTRSSQRSQTEEEDSLLLHVNIADIRVHLTGFKEPEKSHLNNSLTKLGVAIVEDVDHVCGESIRNRPMALPTMRL